MTTAAMAIKYEDYAHMIEGLAWRYRWLDEVEDLISEGKLAYMKARETWNPKLGKFSTWLMAIFSNRLRDLAKEKKRMAGVIRRGVSLDNMMCPKATHPMAGQFFLDGLVGLGQEARDVVQMLLDAPAEIVEELGQTPSSRRAGVRDLLVNQGTPTAKAYAILREIKRRIRQL